MLIVTQSFFCTAGLVSGGSLEYAKAGMFSRQNRANRAIKLIELLQR